MSRGDDGSRFIRIQAYVPRNWIPIIKEFIQKKGYWSISDLVRDLIRRHVVEQAVGVREK